MNTFVLNWDKPGTICLSLSTHAYLHLVYRMILAPEFQIKVNKISINLFIYISLYCEHAKYKNE